jgi:hypothetical protein
MTGEKDQCTPGIKIFNIFVAVPWELAAPEIVRQHHAAVTHESKYRANDKHQANVQAKSVQRESKPICGKLNVVNIDIALQRF